MPFRFLLRLIAFLVIAIGGGGPMSATGEARSAVEWPRCDEGGPGARTCSYTIPGGACSITCHVGSACCSVYDGCYCLLDE